MARFVIYICIVHSSAVGFMLCSAIVDRLGLSGLVVVDDPWLMATS